MTAAYKVGDQVQLKSGGPIMTVSGIIHHTVNLVNDDTEGHVKCQWFSGKKLEKGVFPLDSLKPAEEGKH